MNKKAHDNQKIDAPPHLKRCGLIGARFLDARSALQPKGWSYQEALRHIVKIRSNHKIYKACINYKVMTFDKDFWNRNSKQVARDLMFSGVFNYSSASNAYSGVLTEVDAWDAAIRDTDSELFSLAPGSIGVFSSRRGNIPVITAHADGKTGLITLRKIVAGSEDLGPKAICEKFGFGQLAGARVGENGLYFTPKAIDYARQGLQIVDEIPKGSPANRIAYFKAVRA